MKTSAQRYSATLVQRISVRCAELATALHSPHAALYRHLRRWCSIWAASVMRVENSDGKRVRSSAGGPHGCYPLYFYVVTIWGLRCFAPAIRDSGLTRNRWCFRHQRCITGPAPVWRCAAGFLDKRNGSLVDNISFSVSPSISHPGH